MSYRRTAQYRHRRNQNITCAFCKKVGHHIAQCRVLNNMECQNCHQKGHTTNRCTNPPSRRIRPSFREEQNQLCEPVRRHNNRYQPVLREYKPITPVNRFTAFEDSDSSSDEEDEIVVQEPQQKIVPEPQPRKSRRVHFANDEPDCYGPLEKPRPTRTKVYEIDAPPIEVSVEKVPTPTETSEFLSDWMSQKRSTNAWKPRARSENKSNSPKVMPKSWADWDSSSDEESDDDEE